MRIDQNCISRYYLTFKFIYLIYSCIFNAFGWKGFYKCIPCVNTCEICKNMQILSYNCSILGSKSSLKSIN